VYYILMRKESITHTIEVEQPESRARKNLVRAGLGVAGLGLAVGAGVGVSELTTNGNPTFRETTALEHSILGVNSDVRPNTFYTESSDGIVDLQSPPVDVNGRS
jgi:hypothetical protein